MTPQPIATLIRTAYVVQPNAGRHAGLQYRWQVRDLSEKTAELTQAVQRHKRAAATYGLTLFLAAQIDRGQDRSPLAEFLPPPLSTLKQTGALAEECNVALREIILYEFHEWGPRAKAAGAVADTRWVALHARAD